jgi:hypothetical protein
MSKNWIEKQRRRRRRIGYFLWIDLKMTREREKEKSIASHVDEAFLLTVENELNIDIDMKCDCRK